MINFIVTTGAYSTIYVLWRHDNEMIVESYTQRTPMSSKEYIFIIVSILEYLIYLFIGFLIDYVIVIIQSGK